MLPAIQAARFRGATRVRCIKSTLYPRASTLLGATTDPNAVNVPDQPSACSGEENTRLYRFAYVKPLSALLRLKGLHLTAGVAVLLPTYSIVTTGGLGSLGLADVATLAAVVTGTIGAGSTLSWYCERIVGELTYRRRSSNGSAVLRVSTLTMWGNRMDRDFPVAELMRSEGFAPARSAAAIAAAGVSPYPAEGFVPLELDGKTLIFLWGRKHVLEPDALANVLVARALPFPE